MHRSTLSNAVLVARRTHLFHQNHHSKAFHKRLLPTTASPLNAGRSFCSSPQVNDISSRNGASSREDVQSSKSESSEGHEDPQPIRRSPGGILSSGSSVKDAVLTTVIGLGMGEYALGSFATGHTSCTWRVSLNRDLFGQFGAHERIMLLNDRFVTVTKY